MHSVVCACLGINVTVCWLRITIKWKRQTVQMFNKWAGTGREISFTPTFYTHTGMKEDKNEREDRCSKTWFFFLLSIDQNNFPVRNQSLLLPLIEANNIIQQSQLPVWSINIKSGLVWNRYGCACMCEAETKAKEP